MVINAATAFGCPISEQYFILWFVAVGMAVQLDDCCLQGGVSVGGGVHHSGLNY